ncbi:hypothetical protein R1flu_026654 [Riccia fluitans]|uniref:TCTP domain-containing protein n=1 Tax=Riccia fluitans TaxID=41844 RepID=A0ABD1XJJ5_9MARC
MLVYQDLLTSDELVDDTFPINKEIANGALWEVEGKWVTKEPVKVPDVEVNRPSTVHDIPKKVIDIVDTFQLQEKKEITDENALVNVVKKYVDTLTPKVPAERQEHIKKNLDAELQYLVSKFKDYDHKVFVGESTRDDCAPVLCYYKEGAVNPHFVYFADGLKEIKA